MVQNLGMVSICCSGHPLELPEHFVPSAFREWDVHLYDWQTQCSSKASSDDGLRVALKRLMPTVGVSRCTHHSCKSAWVSVWTTINHL